MSESDRPGTRIPAYVQVWGKGFRVSEDSEEFQRLVPRESGVIDFQLEHYLGERVDWGKVLEPLYILSDLELAGERCVLVQHRELMSISVAPTWDRHHRRSLVLVAATACISWDDDQIGKIVSRCHALSSRLADAYGKAFESNPSNVESQLRASKFLPDRQFDLESERSKQAEYWDHVMLAVKEWNGVFGVATPKFLSLGANIVFGTRHEAEMLQLPVDGYFDSRDLKIYPLSGRLTRWRPGVPISSDAAIQKDVMQSNGDTVVQDGLAADAVGLMEKKEEPAPGPGQEHVEMSRHVESIAVSLRGIDRSFGRIADVIVDFFERVAPLWFADKQDKKKSRR